MHPLLLLPLLMSSISAEPMLMYVVNNELNGTTMKCDAETASFGPGHLFPRISGVLVNALPSNGCLPLAPPPYTRSDSQVWVALIERDSRHERSSCNFDRKVHNAQAAGFGAVLVKNYEDDIISMHASPLGPSCGIPAAMVTDSCGVMLRQYAFGLSGDKYSLLFRELATFDFTIYVFCFVVVVTFCFGIFTVLWTIRLCRDWRRRRRSRLSKSSLKRLKVKKFDKGTDPYECCAVCLDDFQPGDKLRILPCNHAYHCKCIDPWLLKSRSTCPICKRTVFPGRDADGSESGDGAATSAPGAAAAAADDASERTPLLQSGDSHSSGTFENPVVSLRDERTSESAAVTPEGGAGAAAGEEADQSSVNVRVFVHNSTESHNRLV